MKIFSKIAVIWSLSKRAYGSYKKQIIFLSVLGLLGGLLDGIGINALIPLFSFAVGKDGGATDKISQLIADFFSHFHIFFSVKYLLIFISILFVFKAVVLIIFSYISAYITSSYEEKTRADLFSNFLKAKWSYLIQQKFGYLETVLMRNVRNSSMLLGYISETIMLVATTLIYIIVAINISPFLIILTILLAISLSFLFKPFLYKMHLLSTEEEILNKQIAHHVNENIMGLKTIKSTMVGDKVAEIGRIIFKKIKQINVKSSIFISTTDALIQPISLIFICFIFAVSYRRPDFNFASLIAIVYLIRQIFLYFNQLQKKILTMSGLTPYLKTILEYEGQVKNNEELNPGTKDFEFKQNLKFENVYFSYDINKNVLSNINLNINKGELIGLIGPSGGGKTTIVDLILRLFNPNSGKIYLDNVAIDEINLDIWRKKIGYVSQDIFLMNDTFKNNIRFYDDSITDEDVEKAAKMANIYDFIVNSEKGFETVVGERGSLLSAGQRQRIIIARILARQPQLLILDEATSALDKETELEIQKVFENLKGKVTVLIIAHRLSTIMNVDKIFVLEGGHIIEQGSPKELLNNKTTYFNKIINLS